ncbi:hypothetical protein O3P69_002103 [Scylla paramamosain]|uniref:Uncharacterized protein n=1 Tax=Scylla paramamosain TaxID=85552 RepID=A0AAW0V4S9_SCYPA
MVVVILIGVANVDSHLVKINLTVVHPDETTRMEVLDIDDQSFAAGGLTHDQVSTGYAVEDKQGKIQELVVGNKHIPVHFGLKKATELFSFSFVTINNTYWTVNLKNFTNISVGDFDDDETLKPVEVKLDWYLPRTDVVQPLTMALTSAVHHHHSMVWLQHNESSSTIQQPSPGAFMSLRVMNLHTQQTTLLTDFDTDLVELELVETLGKLKEGRMALLTAHSVFLSFLGETVKESLTSMGSFLAQHFMPQTTWAWAWLVSGATLAESLVTNTMGAAHGMRVPPLHFEVTLPSNLTEQPLCREWPDSWTKRQQFCELYDGYDDLCSCSTPFILPKPDNITRPDMWHEVLGVVIVASSRPRYLYRLLRQLTSQPGMTHDQILVSVDGPEHLETIKLVDLLGLKYQIHQPEGKLSPRISRHLRFALFRALNVLSVDKFIILEEDLILAPDFIMYMQQTSVLLDEDPSLYCVSAFSHFSFNHTASDLTKLNRVHSFPAYGWMVKRSFLKETLPKWPPVYVAVDWDYWMDTGIVRMGREVVVPEVSRTAHSGVTGAHFAGSRARETFLRRALSSHSDTYLNITMMQKKDYEEEIKELLASATPLNITHLFTFNFPKEGGIFAVCVHMQNLHDTAAFRLLTQYLGVWNRDAREGHFGLWRLPYYRSLILIVGVPYSKYRDGEEWRKYRTIMNRRLLRHGPLVPHLPALGRVCDSLVDRWASLFASRPVPELERELYRWSTESLGVIVFGCRLGLLGETPNTAEEQQRVADMGRFIESIHGIFKETVNLGTIPPALARSLRLPSWKRFARCLDDALATGHTLVSAALRASKEQKARGEDPDPPTLLDQLLHEDQLEESIILCLLIDLFLAAADTTSHTAIWSLYLLGRHPEVAHRVRQEIVEVTGGTGQVQGHHLASLSYLRGVVKESLRMYPVAPFQTRVLVQDTNLGGYEIPAETMVILSVYRTGRDPTVFPNPDSFSPERWLRSTHDPSTTAPCCISPAPRVIPRVHSHAFIPFGVGIRSCIGRRVAEAELYLLLAKLVARVDLRALNQVDMVLRMVGVTSEPLQLQIELPTSTVTTHHPCRETGC